MIAFTPQMWGLADCRFQLKPEMFPLALDTANLVLVARLVIACIAFWTLKNASLEKSVTMFNGERSEVTWKGNRNVLE